MKITALISFFVMSIATQFACANSGFASLGAGGLEFGESEDIVLEEEVLTITPTKVDISYRFRNTSKKNIAAIVAFPMPDIKCGWFERWNYPDDFVTHVNDKKIELSVEVKAIIESKKADRYLVGQDISDMLRSNNMPLDCRAIEKTRPSSEDMDTGLISDAHRKLIGLGLAYDVTTVPDPWEIYYKSVIKYYWNQVFPAESVIRIDHSYRPSYGAGNKGLPQDDDILTNLDLYKSFYEKQADLKPVSDRYTGHNGYVLIDYILLTANSWKGPINDFRLILPNTENFVVTNIVGEISYENGELIIKKKNFSPGENLRIVFFGLTRYANDVYGIEEIKL